MYSILLLLLSVKINCLTQFLLLLVQIHFQQTNRFTDRERETTEWCTEPCIHASMREEGENNNRGTSTILHIQSTNSNPLLLCVQPCWMEHSGLDGNSIHIFYLSLFLLCTNKYIACVHFSYKNKVHIVSLITFMFSFCLVDTGATRPEAASFKIKTLQYFFPLNTFPLKTFFCHFVQISSIRAILSFSKKNFNSQCIHCKNRFILCTQKNLVS